MLIDFINNEYYDISDEHLFEIERVIAMTLDTEGFYYDTEMTVVFVSSEEIRELNKKYRKIDKETDVLSFPSYELEPEKYGVLKNEEIPIMLGDIVISVEQAKKQAEEYGHALIEELAFLTIHSTLHLLGYDHIDFEDAAKMTEKQDKLLVEADISRGQ